MAASSDGEASPSASTSVMRSRAGSASAACTAARRARPEYCSVIIDSILTEIPSISQDGGVTSAPVLLPRRLAAEFLGSAFLAAIVIGSGIAAQQLSPGNTGLQLMENAAATAAGLFAIILMFGPVSGGHFNPVVSLADAALGGLSWRDAAAYLPFQVAGWVGGAGLAHLMFSDPAVSISAKHRASGGHFLSEIVATMGLLLVIFALARTGRARAAPAAVGAYIGAANFFASSTSFANPAITVGRMLSNTFAGIAPSSAPGFIAAQVVGGVLAVGLIRLLYPGMTPAQAADVIVPHGQNGLAPARDIEPAASHLPDGDGSAGDGAQPQVGRVGLSDMAATSEGDLDAPGGDRRQ